MNFSELQIGDVVRHNADHQGHKRRYGFSDRLTVRRIGVDEGRHTVVWFEGYDDGLRVCLYRLEHVERGGPW